MTEYSHFTYRPIGILRSPYARRIDAPHPPVSAYFVLVSVS